MEVRQSYMFEQLLIHGDEGWVRQNFHLWVNNSKIENRKRKRKEIEKECVCMNECMDYLVMSDDIRVEEEEDEEECRNVHSKCG